MGLAVPRNSPSCRERPPECCTFLGVVIGPPVFGVLATLSGTYRTGFVALMGVASLCGVLLLRLVRLRAD